MALISLASPIFALTVVSLVYFIWLAFYRLCFSPLARFPGPKLAAATRWYEFYFDWWLGGKFVFEVERLHNEFGPIVRINPDELSINDPDFYNEIYVTEYRRRTEHYDVFAKGIDFDGSFLLTKDHDLHRKRRRPFEPFFSKKGISSFQLILAEIALKLESRLCALEGTGQIIRLDHAFSCYSGDIMSRICLGKDDSRPNFLSDPDFSPGWYNVVHKMVVQTPLFTAFPWLIRIVSTVPQNLLLWAFPQGQVFNTFTQEARQHIRKILSEVSDKRTKASVFHTILTSDMPESEKTEDRLTKEAQSMLAAGTVTTARTIVVATYYILSQPNLRSRLAAELSQTMSCWPRHSPTWSELEKLPLLQAIIKETLRISYGVMHRLPRISPHEPIFYKNYFIPAGIPVGMSAYLMHSNPDIYPSPHSFVPDRWIGDIDPAMNRSWVPFCRGSRNCIGMNLAMAEMSLILAVLFRPNSPKLELFETDESDVTLVHDFLIPLPRLDTKGVRATVG
ncbi:cytochrome P450 [Lindgomyces ingoldianus]|uniref:Cytochrome P450 n=1 Tax=Lindgomyces ingoldianus TaxID=673940 RepID=A0ACB6QJT2_9PLEO|nr:cytochrome P450 [Lindgomyces ingoldianus]KAF2466572.1 cytochrome P450 [Lindgomyces ingoldianus]